MTAFATVADIQNRLDFTLDELEQTAVTSALADMSDEARFYAGRGWPEPADPPAIVRRLVIKSVQRWANNMHSYTRSAAGDEAVTFTDLKELAGAPYFTDDERKTLKAAGTGRIGAFFGSVFANAYESNQLYGPGPTAPPNQVHPADGGKPIDYR